MNSLRFGTALSAIAIATALTGCATFKAGERSASIFGGKVDTGNIGLATKALAAFEADDYPTAIKLAERAVENSPNDAGFRGLLGRIYFASGRFASAEAAFRDSLGLLSNQPDIALKLALTQIAQGRHAEAKLLLTAARDILEAADYGLALALAGEPAQAAAMLEAAAREPGADARLRQNLALAHALAGDWTAARTVAAQDLSADQVDARVKEWMSFATPARASDQVAALTGVVPAALDPGQPVKLALKDNGTRLAALATAAQQPAPEPASVMADYVPVPHPYGTSGAEAPAEPVVVHAAATLDPSPAPAFVAPEPAPLAAPPPMPPARPVVKAASAKIARLVRKTPAAAPVRTGGSTAVVQLGAYGSPQRVAAAWSAAARRYAALRGYAPMSARFDGPQGRVYRLSVRGFATGREAATLCESLRRSGGSCFVRSVAGDAPVRMASR